ncbi:hypothetical protein BpHYR1_037333 [Brachionus plicatilis]|uniref:Uncharacterized protein n=1 Tax=Brachionus plicatilis TaxID=10195 RepID=A0A3M7RSZ2_BRAPC|nr:hypothetical protein BpHYR1_037333 [Brachionus plicatilis]
MHMKSDHIFRFTQSRELLIAIFFEGKKKIFKKIRIYFIDNREKNSCVDEFKIFEDWLEKINLKFKLIKV